MRGFAIGLALSLLGAAGAAQGADPVVLEMADEYPANSMPGEGDQFFAGKVEEKTGGQIKIKIHFDASKGKSRDIFQAVSEGTLALGNPFAGALADVDPFFLLPSLPFLAVSADHARQLFDVARPQLERALESRGQKLLYVTPWPPSGLWAKKPVRNLADVASLKLRTYDPTGTALFKSLGAQAVSISFADAMARLKAGEVDSVLSSGDGGAGRKLWELLPHFTEINYAMPLSLGTVSLRVWDGLDPAKRTAFIEAGRDTSERQWRIIRDRVALNYATLLQNGMSITTDLSPELREALKRAAQPAIEAWANDTGEAGRAVLAEFRKRSGS
jgi:TRAP-type transport system periplasmic protein